MRHECITLQITDHRSIWLCEAIFAKLARWRCPAAGNDIPHTHKHTTKLSTVKDCPYEILRIRCTSVGQRLKSHRDGGIPQYVPVLLPLHLLYESLSPIDRCSSCSPPQHRVDDDRAQSPVHRSTTTPATQVTLMLIHQHRRRRLPCISYVYRIPEETVYAIDYIAEFGVSHAHTRERESNMEECPVLS